MDLASLQRTIQTLPGEPRMLRKAAITLSLLVGVTPAAFATTWQGTLYYTNFIGSNNVNSVDYTYDDTAHSFSLSAPNPITTAGGADGIIFDAHGNLLVGGQNSGFVYQYTTSGTLLSSAQPGSTGQNQGSYHLTLDPSGTKVYTSDFQGPLDIVPLSPTLSQGTTRTISGGDTGVTQVAFGLGGAVFYVDGPPNGGGNLGTINLNTGITTRLWSGVTPAHGLVYDPYTSLITMFGEGYTGTMNASNGSNLKVSTGSYACDFDQGALDGHGHALVAGCGEITLIDYSVTGDITDNINNYHASIGGFTNIDDVAPLTGAGSQQGVPEPASFALLGSALLGMGILRRRKG